MFTKLAQMLACTSLLFVTNVFAQGKLSYSIKYQEGFSRIDVEDANPGRQGVWADFGARIQVQTYTADSRLHLPLAQNQDSLEFKVASETSNYYVGFLWFSHVTKINTYRDVKKGTLLLKGNIGDDVKFDFRTEVSKKGKKSFSLYFTDANIPDVEFSLNATFTPEKKEGSCKGTLTANMTEFGIFNCQSSGTLKDAFFWSEEDIIAWLVHLLIIPADKGSDDGLAIARHLN